MPVWARYFDEDGTLSRRLTFSEFKSMGGRLVPTIMDMRPEDKPGERTTVRYQNLEFGVLLDESFFSLQNLKSRK
jgi:hypothetical protein